MDEKSVQCFSCGKPAAGNFCSHCGAPLVSKCPACGAHVKPGSRACQQCGATLLPRKWSAQTIAPWAALGLAAVALLASLTSGPDRAVEAPPPMPPRFSEIASQPFPGGASSVDLSSMSPREAADRLFNRVMTANEGGNTDEALKFVPMALQAYERVGTLDNDARYHVALIHLVAGDTNGARAQLDKLRQSVPNHLLGYMIERELAERSGNAEVAARAYRGFLAAYDKEKTTARTEYQDHQGTIERFRDAARAAVAGKR